MSFPVFILEVNVNVVFYDRKNKREVKSSQLMFTNCVRTLVQCDDQELQFSDRRLLYDKRHKFSEPITEEQFNTMVEHGIIDIQISGPWSHLKQEKVVKYGYPVSEQIGNIAYKSENCPSYCNWDLYCMDTDLVFLRLEE